MSRRSGRERKASKASVAPSVLVGLQSLAEGNEGVLSEMLSESTGDTVVDKVLSCMHVNSLSYEMLLANYLDAGLLSEYCETRLGKSGKGSAATLAERIAREWAKPSFQPRSGTSGTKRKAEVVEGADGGGDEDEDEDEEDEKTARRKAEKKRRKKEKKREKKEKKRRKKQRELAAAGAAKTAESTHSIYSLTAADIHGDELQFDRFKGNVLLVTNVASY